MTIKGKTKSGFEYEVEKEAGDDWELVEDLSNARTNGYALISAAHRLVGNGEQYSRLKDHCRGENGRVSEMKMSSEMTDIITALTSKNS
jgi:hypothetical protein